MADANYFEDADDSPDKPEVESSTKSEQQTALVPKDFFGSKELEIGKECRVKIIKILDDEIQIEKVPHGKDDDYNDTEEMPAPAMSDEMMADVE